MILRVMNHMGLRLGEALAPRLSNFDWKRKIYHVRESFRQKVLRNLKVVSPARLMCQSTSWMK